MKGRVPHIVLTLYVVPFSTACYRAVTNVTRVLEAGYEGRYVLHVVDIRANPAVTIEKNIYAVPLLEREQPLPARKLLGDISDTAALEKFLG
jgi:circadian clock protein KaiB